MPVLAARYGLGDFKGEVNFQKGVYHEGTLSRVPLCYLCSYPPHTAASVSNI